MVRTTNKKENYLPVNKKNDNLYVISWDFQDIVEHVMEENPETGEMRNVRGKSGRPSQRPPESELAAMYNEYPASYIAKHYGVATFTVRRWIQYYRQNPTNPEGINVMPDKEQPQK